MLGAGLLAIAAFLVFFVWKFEPEIRAILTRGFQVRRGENELVVPAARFPSSEQNSIERPLSTAEVADSKSQPPAAGDPEPTTADEWARKMYDAFILNRNTEQLETAFKKFEAAEPDPEKRRKQELMYHFFRYQCGEASALAELNRLAGNSDVAARANFWIGRCHEDAGDQERAITAFETGLERETDCVERTTFINAIARCMYDKGQKAAAYSFVIKQLPLYSDFEAKAKLYQTLGKLYERSKNYELRAIALEKALELRPNDTSIRFDAAYSYSEIQVRALAHSHYVRLLTFSPNHAAAKNNLGVEAERLNMPLQSVAFYKQGWHDGETLAAANIAFRLIAAGFEEEARKFLDEAKERKDMHPNVGSAFATLAQNQENEKKRNQTVRDDAIAQQQFFQRFGTAYFSGEGGDSIFAGQWLTPDTYFIEIRQDGDLLQGLWEVNKAKYKLEGTVLNDGAIVNFFHWTYATIQGSWQWGFVDDGHGYLCLDRKSNKLLMLRFFGLSHWFMNAARILPAPSPPQLPPAETPALPATS
jgi:tetratricopeptide (TPR) repeat protein